MASEATSFLEGEERRKGRPNLPLQGGCGKLGSRWADLWERRLPGDNQGPWGTPSPLLLCSFQPLLCEPQTFVAHPFSLSFLSSSSPISHSFTTMSTIPLDSTAERPCVTLNFCPLSCHSRPS